MGSDKVSVENHDVAKAGYHPEFSKAVLVILSVM
jgi:hypothetical protein